MNVDLSLEERLELIRAGNPDAVSFVVAVTCGLQAHLGSSVSELDSMPAELYRLLSRGMKEFLEAGGEIHFVIGGKNPGKVLGIECDAGTPPHAASDQA